MITINSRNYVLFTVILGALLFSTVAIAKIKVELKLDNVANPTALQIMTNDSQCDRTILDCIEVKKGEKPNIVFTLPNACDDGSDNPKYKLAGMRITQVDKVWTSPLYDVVADDFNADKKTGIIDFSAGNNEQTNKKLKFKNKNSYEYTVFYEISAKHCSDSTKPEIFLDPAIRNKG